MAFAIRSSSWHTFSFYRLFPSKKVGDGDGVRTEADREAAPFQKLSHDIMVDLSKNLLLYARPSTTSRDGRFISSDPIPGLEIAGNEVPNVEKDREFHAVQLNCHIKPRGMSKYKAEEKYVAEEDYEQINIKPMLTGFPPSKEFSYDVYVLASKRDFDKKSCDDD